MILLVADLQELKANPKRDAIGTIVEAQLDKGRGPVATALVQTGTLKVGDIIVVGETFGTRPRARERHGQARHEGRPVDAPWSSSACPRCPEAGDILRVVADEKAARTMVEARKAEAAAQGRRRQRPRDARGPLPPDPGRPGQGAADHPQGRRVGLARVRSPTRSSSSTRTRSGSTSCSRAPATSPTTTSCSRRRRTRSSSASTPRSPTPARRAAEAEGVDVRLYDIIYKLTDDIEAALKGLLEPEIVEVVEGRAEVRQIFRVGKSTVIAGSFVTDGRIVRGGARVWRGGKVIATDRIESLRRFRDDVREVAAELRVRHRPRQLPRPRRGRHHRVLHLADGEPRSPTA